VPNLTNCCLHHPAGSQYLEQCLTGGNTYEYIIYYRSGTGVCCCCLGVPADRRFVVTRHAAALFWVKWRHGRHLEIMTSNRKSAPSIDAYLREEQSCQISPRSDLKRRSLEFLKDDCPNNNNNKNNKMSSDNEISFWWKLIASYLYYMAYSLFPFVIRLRYENFCALFIIILLLLLSGLHQAQKSIDVCNRTVPSIKSKVSLLLNRTASPVASCRPYRSNFDSKIPVFSVRQHICYSALYAIARPSVRLSVRLSVTRVDQSKTVEVRITQSSPQCSPMTLVSWRLTSPGNSKGKIGIEGAK